MQGIKQKLYNNFQNSESRGRGTEDNFQKAKVVAED
jgi:hypothetical protein